MEDFNIGAMKARNIAAQFGVIEKAKTFDEEVMKAHQVGDMHPNGKWVWTEYSPGHFDWRPLKGRGGVDRTSKKGDEGGSNGGNGGGDDKKPKKPEMKQETGGEDKKNIAGVSDIMEGFRIQTNKYSDLSKMSLQKTPKGNWRLYYDGKDTGTTMQASVISDANAKKAGLWKEEGEEKKAPTLDDHAKKTDTKTLENAAKSSKAPGSVKGAAEAELKERKNKEIAKKLNLHSKGELATELTRIASEWDSYDDAQKTQTKQAIAQAHSTVLKNITSGNASDEAIAALADLTSIQNFFKDSASQPKQVGEIVKDLVADLKAKNFNDTTAGKKEIDEISKKISNVSDGESLWFSFYGGKIQLKKKETLNNGFSTYTMYVNGVGIFSTIKPDDLVESMKKYYPDAKEIKGGETSSEYDAQKLEHLSEDELRNSANKYGVWASVNRHGEISLKIPSKKEVKNLKKFLSDNGINFDETKLIKEPSVYGTHNYSYDLYSGKQENSIGYHERKAKHIQSDIDYLINSSKNHPDERQRAAAKKELENGSLKRELDEVNEKIASLKKMGK